MLQALKPTALLKWLFAAASKKFLLFLVVIAPIAAIILAILLYFLWPEQNAPQNVPQNITQTAGAATTARTATVPADDGGDSGNDEATPFWAASSPAANPPPAGLSRTATRGDDPRVCDGGEKGRHALGTVDRKEQ